MDVSTFHTLFSTTCLTPVGLWWDVVQSRTDRMRDPALRRVVGAFPGLARHVGLRPARAGALMPVVLIILAHALVRRHMAGEGRADEDA
ncbi:hypothetical protein ACIA6T_06230 [Streptomyces sp. NPDC051740]|uniref:hypothetical protein n=1 Tax=Streptomyces sp. NPDC051740 TaxID=3365673 RepID=UPI0037A3080D